MTEQLPAGIDSIGVAIFDVDGTLAREDAKVSDQTIAALADLAKAGVPIVLASGRMAPALAELFDRMGQPGYVIACNGAVTVHSSDNEVISRLPMDPQVYTETIEFGREHDLQTTIFGAYEFYIEQDREARELLRGPNEGRVPKLVNLDEVDPNDRLKAMYYIHPDRHAEMVPLLRATFPDSVQTLPEFFERTAVGVDKWSGIAPILDVLGTTPERALGIGDSENDLGWLPKIGLPIAMGNAYPHVKQACVFEIGNNDDDAVAQFVGRWVDHLKGRQSSQD